MTAWVNQLTNEVNKWIHVVEGIDDGAWKATLQCHLLTSNNYKTNGAGKISKTSILVFSSVKATHWNKHRQKYEWKDYSRWTLPSAPLHCGQQ